MQSQCSLAAFGARAPRTPRPAPGHRPRVIPSISTTYPSTRSLILIIFFTQKASYNKDPIEPGSGRRFRNCTVDTQTSQPILIKSCVIDYKLVHCAAKINLAGLAASQKRRAAAYSGYYGHHIIITFLNSFFRRCSY